MRLRPLRPLDGPEQDFDLDTFQIALCEFHNLPKSFLANRVLRLHEVLILTLQNRTAHGAFALLITLDARFQRHIKKQQGCGHLAPLRQSQQVLSRLIGERGGVDDAQTIQREPLFDEELNESKGLRVEALIAFVVANEGARPIGGNDLGWPKVAFGKCRFTAG
jgi:hypothetical protein